MSKTFRIFIGLWVLLLLAGFLGLRGLMPAQPASAPVTALPSHRVETAKTGNAPARLTEAEEGAIIAAANFAVYYKRCVPPSAFSFQSNMPPKMQRAIDNVTAFYGDWLASYHVLVETQIKDQVKWCADRKPKVEYFLSKS
jgi:hypothetical protein